LYSALRRPVRISAETGSIPARGDIVIDPFLGSGSTLIAADKTGRICRGVELDPLYVDVIVRRYEAGSGEPAVLVETGETFEALAVRRAGETAFARARVQRRADIADEAARALLNGASRRSQ
jgi:hypothetical protein